MQIRAVCSDGPSPMNWTTNATIRASIKATDGESIECSAYNAATSGPRIVEIRIDETSRCLWMGQHMRASYVREQKQRPSQERSLGNPFRRAPQSKPQTANCSSAPAFRTSMMWIVWAPYMVLGDKSQSSGSKDTDAAGTLPDRVDPSSSLAYLLYIKPCPTPPSWP